MHKAVGCYEQALTISREFGDRDTEATTSWNLGLALEEQGELAQAAELMQVSVDYEQGISHPDAEKRAAYLDQLRQCLAAEPGAAPAKPHDDGER